MSEERDRIRELVFGVFSIQTLKFDKRDGATSLQMLQMVLELEKAIDRGIYICDVKLFEVKYRRTVFGGGPSNDLDPITPWALGN